MTDKVDELDKVIKKIANDWLKARNDSKTLKQFEKELADYITQQQHLLLDRVLEEVVGEDETYEDYGVAINRDAHEPMVRNELRYEQRQAIQTIKESLK